MKWSQGGWYFLAPEQTSQKGIKNVDNTFLCNIGLDLPHFPTCILTILNVTALLCISSFVLIYKTLKNVHTKPVLAPYYTVDPHFCCQPFSRIPSCVRTLWVVLCLQIRCCLAICSRSGSDSGLISVPSQSWNLFQTGLVLISLRIVRW